MSPLSSRLGRNCLLPLRQALPALLLPSLGFSGVNLGFPFPASPHAPSAAQPQSRTPRGQSPLFASRPEVDGQGFLGAENTTPPREAERPQALPPP